MTARSLEEAHPKRHHYRASSGRDVQSAVETSDMGLDGILADHQFRSDPLVGVIRHQQGEDLALALSETQMRSWPELAGAQLRRRQGDPTRQCRVDDSLTIHDSA